MRQTWNRDRDKVVEVDGSVCPCADGGGRNWASVQGNRKLGLLLSSLPSSRPWPGACFARSNSREALATARVPALNFLDEEAPSLKSWPCNSPHPHSLSPFSPIELSAQPTFLCFFFVGGGGTACGAATASAPASVSACASASASALVSAPAACLRLPTSS